MAILLLIVGVYYTPTLLYNWTFLVNFFEKPARQVIALFNSESAAYDGRIILPLKLSKFVIIAILAFVAMMILLCAAFDIFIFSLLPPIIFCT